MQRRRASVCPLAYGVAALGYIWLGLKWSETVLSLFSRCNEDERFYFYLVGEGYDNTFSIWSIDTGADLQGGLEGLQPPYSWCNNGGMGRVREKKRWRKEEK
jgi:hypothetical protein